ncbi:MAG: TraR/DksA family transcriptional regulator, partial [Planctomycetales bacterium]|nr:TraR/DksA family transcriptional regulator [Planctomycetales bacterium]
DEYLTELHASGYDSEIDWTFFHAVDLEAYNNADAGTDNYEQDFALRFVENEQETLREISEALSRIGDGSYGGCERCLEEGKTQSQSRINKPRLRAIPFTRFCIECERLREAETP